MERVNRLNRKISRYFHIHKAKSNCQKKIITCSVSKSNVVHLMFGLKCTDNKNDKNSFYDRGKYSICEKEINNCHIDIDKSVL